MIDTRHCRHAIDIGTSHFRLLPPRVPRVSAPASVFYRLPVAKKWTARWYLATMVLLAVPRQFNRGDVTVALYAFRYDTRRRCAPD